MNIIVGLIVAAAIISLIFILKSKSVQDNEPIQKFNGANLDFMNSDLESDILKIVGGFYRPYDSKRFIRTLEIGDTVFFIEEPDNPYDTNAVAVIAENGLHIGYVPRYLTGKVKSKMRMGNIEGNICEEADSRYEYKVMMIDCEDSVLKNKAVALYREKREQEQNAERIIQYRENLNFYDRTDKAAALIEKGEYEKVYSLIKPLFDVNIQDSTCYKCMIYYYHYLTKYEEELEYIDKYVASGNLLESERDFMNRRKFHILRAIGDIQDNSQIENERAGVETTILELDFFHRIVTLLSDNIDPNDIDYKDFKGLFAVYYINSRQPICKLYLNNPDKMFIGLIKEDKSVIKIPIFDIDELNELKHEFIEIINRYK